MRRSKYMVVEHHSKDQELKIVNGKLVGHQPIHHLVGSYHWVRIDNEHIFMVADYSLRHHTAIHSHEKISIFPHTGSSKKLHKHLKDKHFHALKKKFKLDETHTAEDAIDSISATHGPLFSH